MKRISLLLFVLMLSALVVGMTLHFSSKRLNLDDFSLNSPQNANRPLGMPVEGAMDFRFHQFSVWQMLAQPEVTRMDEPMGSEFGSFTYNAQPFWSMNEARGGHHTGDDLNGIGGMNTDLGDPVFAAADGVVVYSGEPSTGWGKILIVGHRLKDGKTFQTMYAHLLKIDVALGSLVGRGQKIAAVGTANGVYPAHLHYEIRTGPGVDIGSGYAAYPLNRVNPAEFSAALHGAADALAQSATLIHLQATEQRDTTELFNQLNNGENREKLIELLDRK